MPLDDARGRVAKTYAAPAELVNPNNMMAPASPSGLVGIASRVARMARSS